MRRSVMACRTALLAAEQSEFTQVSDEAAYNAWVLADGGFIIGEDHRYQAGLGTFVIRGITAAGHDLLDLLRDEGVVAYAMHRSNELISDPDNLTVVRSIIEERIRESIDRS